MINRVLFLSIFIMFSAFVFGQKSKVYGVISLEGSPFSGIKLNLLPSGKESFTNSKGEFEFTNLNEGDYILKAIAPGLKEEIFEFSLVKGEVKEFNFSMQYYETLLDEVQIVSSSLGLTERTPYNIQRIDAKNVSFRGAPSGIMAVLEKEPGVNSAEMGHGIAKPFIRGLGFSRVATIYQGNKLENHQWGADHGLGVSDVGVSNIDVIKGPASVLYGSGALGGVLVVKDDEHYLQRKGKVSGQVSGTFNSTSLGYRGNASLGYFGESGFFFATDLAYESHADYKDGNNRIIGNSRFENNTLRLHSGYKSDKYHGKISLTRNAQSLGIIEDDEMENTLASERNDRAMQLPFQEINDLLISYEHKWNFNENWRSDFDISYHLNERKEIEDDFDDIDLGLMQSHLFYSARFVNKTNSNWVNTFGLQGSFVDMKNMENAEEILIPNAKYSENGVFFLSTYKRENHTFQGALRYDYRYMIADANQQNIIDEGYELPGSPADKTLDLNFGGITGSIGYSNYINKSHVLKVNLSSGFRSPDIAELLSNGPHPGTNRFEIGDVSFNREQSLQADVSWIYQKESFTLQSSIFSNYVDGYIYFQGTGDTLSNGLEIWRFSQTNALLYGGEVKASYKPFTKQDLTINISGNFLRGDDLNNSRNLTFIPADRLGTGIDYKFKKIKSAAVFTEFNYVFRQNRPGVYEDNTNGYLLANIGAKKDFMLNKNKLSIAITVNNLFNQTYFDHIGILRAFEITNPGINAMFNVQYRF